MNLEQLTYPDALRNLAKKYNIPIEEDELSQDQVNQLHLSDSLYVVNHFAQAHFEKQLFETDYGKSVGLSYFKQRGFREETIKKFGLGFANGGANDLMQEGLSQGYPEDVLEKAGLIKNKHDFFKNRVQFPIHNISGKVIGFGGRILTADKKTPKYLNTPESDIYNKRKSLYGVFFARKAIVKQNECYMVEGYTDVISLHQAGIENVVASSGTSLTAEQVQLVKRYAPNMTILYDGDSAGIKAALRGLDIVIEQDMNVKIVLLPEGEDPDSYLKKVGATAFKEYIEKEAHDFIIFKSSLLLKDVENDPIKKADVIRDIIESIAKIPDALKRSIYVKECSRLMDMSEEILHTEINKRIQNNSKKIYQKNENQEQHSTNQENNTQSDNGENFSGNAHHQNQFVPQKVATTEYQELDIVRILVSFGDRKLDAKTSIAEFILLDMVELELLEEFEHQVCGKIVNEYLNQLKANNKVCTTYFTHHPDQEIAQLTINLLASMEEYQYSANWLKMNVFLNTQEMPDENHIADAKSGIRRFKLKKVERLIDKNQKEIKVVQNSENAADVLILIKVHQKLTALRSELAKQLNTVVLK